MHHAYLYTGSLSDLAALADDAQKRFEIEKEHNPDFQIRTYEKFGIEEARELQTAAALKSTSGHALYIVGVSQITTEAQQALLKLFEEPQEGLIFILLAPHGSIIPTLKSRFLEYPSRQITPKKVLGSPVSRKAALGPDHFSAQSANSFLSSTNKARSAEIAKLLKDEEGIRERMRDFLNSLEVALHSVLLKSKNKKEIIEGLEDIAKVRSYANDRSPSMKMLLEHLALSLPILH